jgi:DNA-binding PadR family transcriptional regulator
MSILIGVESSTFAYLKEATNTSDGNLSTHLTKLEAAGYIAIEKSFVGKKPQTTCAITKAGRTAFTNYLAQLEQIVKMQKNGDW